MKKSTLLLMLFTGWYTGIVAQEARPATIYGQIRSNKDSIRLIVWVAKDPIVAAGDELTKITTTVQSNGSFSFSTPPISKLARLEIFDLQTGNYICALDQQMVAPGDSVRVSATFNDKAGLAITFTGKGAAKFECLQLLTTDYNNWRILDTARGIKKTVALYDSILNSKMAILKKYSRRLPKEEYKLMQADIAGETALHALWSICGYNPGAVHSRKPTADELAAQKQAYAVFRSHVNDAGIDKTTASLSMHYCRYLDNKAKAEQLFENNGQPVTMPQLFTRLRNTNNGMLHDKLLGHLFLNRSENYRYFGGIDPDEYLKCLTDANNAIQSAEIRERIKQTVSSSVKGATAFNFDLPLDSSETNRLSLTDLKGKVVLLDLWSYQCTGCVLFSNTFHKKLFPAFQNNPDFAVVSIMLDEYAGKDKYMYRLRKGGGVAYTFPEYTNLFGGQGISSAREMEKYHTIDAYPTIMLIDKQGKIYSSTLPAIYGDPRNKELENNIQKLKNLIQQALSEPAAQKTIL